MANLTTLASGSSVVLTVTDQQTIVLNNGRSDVARLSITTGPGAGRVVTASHNGRRVYGPFGAGTITLAAVSGDCRYELSGDATSPLDDDGQPLTSSENQSVRSLVSGAGIDTLIEPWCIAHRGAGAALAPDSTLAAYALGATWGTGIIDGGDWYAVSDGGVFDFHDTTLTPKTDQTGNTEDATSAQMSRIKIDASSWFGGGFQDVYGCMTPEVFFGTLRGRTCFAPEPKNIGAANYLAAYLPTLALQRQCLVNAFTDALLQPFIDAGTFPYLFRNLTPGAEHSGFTTARANELLAKGIRYLGVNATDANAATAAATAAAAGMKVIVGLVNRQNEKATWDALGIVKGYVSDDPVYAMGRGTVYRRTTDPYGSGAYYHGHLPKKVSGNEQYTPGPDKRGVFLSGGKLQHEVASDAFPNFILSGWNCPLPASAQTTTYTISGTLTIDTVPADKFRGPAWYFCNPTDKPFEDTSADSVGYQFWIRPSTSGSGGAAGDLNGVVKNAGVSGTQVVAALSAEVVAGMVINWTFTASFSAGVATTVSLALSGAVTGTCTITSGANGGNTHRGLYWGMGHRASCQGLKYSRSAESSSV